MTTHTAGAVTASGKLYTKQSGRQPSIKRKSYQFASERLSFDPETTAKFRRLILAAYGRGWSITAPKDIGCAGRSLYGWTRGERPAPIEAVEAAERRLDRRLREHEAATVKLHAEIAAARQSAKILKAGAVRSR